MLDVLPRSLSRCSHGGPTKVAALPESSGVLQHREQTDRGGAQTLSQRALRRRARGSRTAHRGSDARHRERAARRTGGALQGEDQPQAARGAGYSAHQDAPVYPVIANHVSAMVASRRLRRRQRRPRGCLRGASTGPARWTTEGASTGRSRRRSTWEAVVVPAGTTLWFHSRTPHRSGPNRSPAPARALYPTYNAAAKATAAPSYYRDEGRHVAATEPGDRALVSLIGDFEGRPGEGRVHGARLTAGRAACRRATHAGADRVGARSRRRTGAGPSRDDGGHVPQPRHVRDRRATHSEHGIGTNFVPRTGGFTPAWELGPAVPDLFDACHGHRSNRARPSWATSASVGVMGARRADSHWPPDGEIPEDAGACDG